MWKGVGPVRRGFEWPISSSRAEWNEFQLRLCTIRDSKIPKKKGTVGLYALHTQEHQWKNTQEKNQGRSGTWRPEDQTTWENFAILCHPTSTNLPRLRLFHRPLCYCRWPDILRDGGPLWRPDLKFCGRKNFWCQDMGSMNHFVDWSRKWQRT